MCDENIPKHYIQKFLQELNSEYKIQRESGRKLLYNKSVFPNYDDIHCNDILVKIAFNKHDIQVGLGVLSIIKS